MNHLAHAFLARDTPAGIIGNLAGDFVRGPVDTQFEPEVADGIRLHRHIDSYTDAHDLVRRSRKRFVGGQRRVAGVVIDVYHDYFLCQHWSEFSEETFDAFCRRIYATLQIHQGLAPDPFRQYIPHFVNRDMLASCTTLDGVSRVIARIATRWERKGDLQSLLIRAGDDARNSIDEIRDDFLGFFPQLQGAVESFKESGWVSAQH